MVVFFKNKKTKKFMCKKLCAKIKRKKKCATQNSFRMKLACQEHVGSMSKHVGNNSGIVQEYFFLGIKKE
jgi:hypothetical protein